MSGIAPGQPAKERTPVDRRTFSAIEKHMLERMNDSSHDEQHVYRVLYAALDIASGLEPDMDVLIAAALLHDIGREAQFKDPGLDHASIGAELAFDYLKGRDWTESKAAHVRDCIAAHRFRKQGPEPSTIEAKILFDADQLDVAGTIGIARPLAYKGVGGEPLYSIAPSGEALDGSGDEGPSFFKEYHFKLKNVYGQFYTDRARELAAGRREASLRFYESMRGEVNETQRIGMRILDEVLALAGPNMEDSF
jgi:uncharacterized protein